jgi:hypothetical protein
LEPCDCGYSFWVAARSSAAHAVSGADSAGSGGPNVIGVPNGVVDVMEHLLQVDVSVGVSVPQRDRDHGQALAQVNRPEAGAGGRVSNRLTTTQ